MAKTFKNGTKGTSGMPFAGGCAQQIPRSRHVLNFGIVVHEDCQG